MVWGTEVPQRGPGAEPGMGYGGQSPPEAKTLLLNEHAIFNDPLMKIVKFVNVYCPRNIFSRNSYTAHLEISTAYFVLRNTPF